MLTNTHFWLFNSFPVDFLCAGLSDSLKVKIKTQPTFQARTESSSQEVTKA